MPESSKRILFIVHDAARSGAPVLLLHFLRWLKQADKNTKFDVLILKDGPLRKDFEDLAKIFLVPKAYRYTLVNKIKVRLNPDFCDVYRIAEVAAKLSRNNYDLVYGNTIVSLPYLLEFKRRLKIKIVCAIHELSNAIAFYFNQQYISAALPQTDLIIAGSQAVAKNLKDEFNIHEDKIRVFHSFIDTNYNILKNGGQLKSELRIANDELVIGGMSQIELRKGVDLVVPLAVELKLKYPEVKFKLIWVGGLATDNFIQIVKQDALKCGVSEQVLFIERTPNPNDYINLFDVFLLLSREDPFPLVLLSAANMAKGIIAFNDSGGAIELLNNGAGFMAPYLNISAMTDIIADLYHHPEKIKIAGEKTKKKLATEFNSESISQSIFNELNSLLKLS